MKSLIYREFKLLFCSPSSAFFSLAFLIISGCFLWLLPGSYNIIDGGYANINRFFSLAPNILIILIPALSMRMYAEENKSKTADILKARPIKPFSIYVSKLFAVFSFITITIACTSVYVYSIYQLASPSGNIDIQSILASYFSLLFLSLVFTSIALLGSSVTKNQIVALIISISLSLFIFYGFDLTSNLASTGSIKILISSFGIGYHYESMHKGALSLKSICLYLSYTTVFSALVIYANNRASRILSKVMVIISILTFISLIIPNYTIDLSEGKRYTLSKYSKDLLEQSKDRESLEVNIYLNGDLNYGFQNLRNNTVEVLENLNSITNGNLNISNTNPYQNKKSSDEIYSEMSSKGMAGIILNESDREGKISQKVIYPYVSITNTKDTIIIPLLKNIPGKTADENLNASIENLEYEFINALRIFYHPQQRSIAFIEGHNELSRTNIYDAEELLSKDYSINRGEIGNDPNILNQFDAIVIAGPLGQFKESEKYIIDQYLMQGGRILWLIDGAFYSHQDLVKSGFSATIKNNTGLDDILFSYGVRINPDLIQDTQCINTYIIGENSQSSTLAPNYFQPILIPSQDLPITHNIRDVKAGFASSIDIVNNNPDIRKNILLTTSENTHLLKVPDVINYNNLELDNETYFDESYIPVAVSLEGRFNSAFLNRSIPDSITIGNHQTISKSINTKMIVVSSSEIISNELEGQGEDTKVLPMGYDRVSQQLFGNRDFIINAVNWLTDDDGLMQLRAKKQKIHHLNKTEAFENRTKYAVINISIPIFIMLSIIGSVFLYRKRKYE